MATTTLEVRHDTVYRYETPVSLAQHLAHLKPLDDGAQALLTHTLVVDPAPAWRRDGVDVFGNAQTHFSVTEPHHTLRVRSASMVRVAARFGGLRAESGPAWETLAARLRYTAPPAAGALPPAQPLFEPAAEFVPPSPYVPRLPELRAWALPSFPPGRTVAAGALDLMRRLHAEFAYDKASTHVETPLAQVLAQRRGVCQDFAHLLIGGLRILGLPARYVSGYLLTEPAAAGGASLAAPVGADASHAWVQVWCPGTEGVPAQARSSGWLDLDPTNDSVPGAGHVQLAVGRDYGDVAPLRGVIRGGGRHTLAVAVATRVLDDTTDAGQAASAAGAGTVAR